MTCSPGNVRVSFCFVALLAIGAAGCGAGDASRNNTTFPPIGEILHFVEQGELSEIYGGELGKKPADAAEALQLLSLRWV